MPLGADTVTIVRPAATDWQGDPGGNTTEATVTGCMVEPSGSHETNSGGDTVTSDFAVWLPDGTDILATDRVRLADGTVCAVDGRPERWHDDQGADGHVRAMLRLTEGT
jgi:head-tail adaptor